MKKKAVLLLVCMLLLGAATGGTLAWLSDETETVTNSFTVGKIQIALTEHKLEHPNDDVLSNKTTINQNTYLYVPGGVRPKDPWVTVKSGSEACYVFIRIQEEGNTLPGTGTGDILPEKIIGYEVISDTWTPLSGQDGYYYYTLPARADQDQILPILKDDQVTVSPNVTKAMLEELSKRNTQLIFTAAAIQKDSLPAATDGQTEVDVAFANLPAEFKAP